LQSFLAYKRVRGVGKLGDFAYVFPRWAWLLLWPLLFFLPSDIGNADISGFDNCREE
jgi:hypothetical protein